MMDPSGADKRGTVKHGGDPGKDSRKPIKEKKVVGFSGHDVELKELTKEPAPSSCPKTPESESRREKGILMKAKERRETSVDLEDIEQEKVGEDDQWLPGRLVKYLKPPREQGGDNWEERKAVGIDVGGSTQLSTPIIKSKSASSLPSMTFPQVVDQVRAHITMGNVRRSSALGEQTRPTFILPSLSVLKHDQETQTVQPSEEHVEDKEELAVAKGQAEQIMEDDGNIRGNGTALQRRHSTGSARSVNRANLMALIRRFQRRRIRPPTKSTAVKFIQYFMAFLYYICMSPVEPESAKKYNMWVRWLQYVVFWIFTASSLLQSLGDTKSMWIRFRNEESMLTFVTFGFFYANFLIRIYQVKLFATSSTAISNLWKKIDRVNNAGAPVKGGWAKSVAIFVGITAMLMSGISTLFADDPLYRWTFKNAMLSRAYEMGEYLFLWSAQNYDDTVISILKKYGRYLSNEVKLFAAIGSWLNFFGILHSCIMLDIWPIVATQIFILQCHFTNALDRTKKENCRGRCPLSIQWKHYIELREVCDETHEVFGRLIKLIHIQNIFLFGNFLLQVLKKEAMHMDLLINLISVIKISFTYYMVQKSADKNEKYEECIIKCSEWRSTIEIDGIERNVSVLLRDMKKHPIGVGRGEFFVNEAFILKFAATVGSIFLLLADESGEKCVCTCPMLF